MSENGNDIVTFTIMKTDRRLYSKFTESPRHAVQVEWIPYLDELAREVGCRVDFWQLFVSDFQLWRRLFFGPSLPYQYRLQGPHAWAKARNAIMTAKERIDCPLRVNRATLTKRQDHALCNPLYADHNFLFAFVWGILGALFMDLIFFYS